MSTRNDIATRMRYPGQSMLGKTILNLAFGDTLRQPVQFVADVDDRLLEKSETSFGCGCYIGIDHLCIRCPFEGKTI